MSKWAFLKWVGQFRNRIVTGAPPTVAGANKLEANQQIRSFCHKARMWQTVGQVEADSRPRLANALRDKSGRHVTSTCSLTGDHWRDGSVNAVDVRREHARHAVHSMHRPVHRNTSSASSADVTAGHHKSDDVTPRLHTYRHDTNDVDIYIQWKNVKKKLNIHSRLHLYILCNFVKSYPIFKLFALLESVWNLLQNPYNIHFKFFNRLNSIKEDVPSFFWAQKRS